MRLEITHTIKCLDYTAFMRAYNEVLEIDRKSHPSHKEPRVMVSVFGELNKIRIEFEGETSDPVFQSWIENDCPSSIETTEEHHERFLKFAERTEVQWLKEVKVAAV
ncbi:MAG: hypothetical protein HOI20_26020 [Gemmatimonadetes bacterium]|jgi:hypothetical protein|nr:hypothetical protein [Gemmatimonadota bacterium]MBT5805061.1 hypothetical protein [Gemmatimonadota bacterium]MBT6623282.1 hypothetical protein [Gemmatimonadota bacterium]MBT6904438.1 hypothetical protein [Gemmatimonadota bacterium]MBT7417205.1 hypothetical protein [Gemmatimonadota bacterium]